MPTVTVSYGYVRCVKRLPCLANEWLLCVVVRLQRRRRRLLPATFALIVGRCASPLSPPLLLPLLAPAPAQPEPAQSITHLGCQLHSESRGANAHLGLSPFPNASTHSSLYIALSFSRSLYIAYIVYGIWYRPYECSAHTMRKWKHGKTFCCCH